MRNELPFLLEVVQLSHKYALELVEESKSSFLSGKKIESLDHLFVDDNSSSLNWPIQMIYSVVVPLLISGCIALNWLNKQWEMGNL